jgi:hypothetical protein
MSSDESSEAFSSQNNFWSIQFFNVAYFTYLTCLIKPKNLTLVTLTKLTKPNLP